MPGASSALSSGWPLRRAPVILTREELDAEKAELRAIDSRPIKKVAEAKARKRKRLSVRFPSSVDTILNA